MSETPKEYQAYLVRIWPVKDKEGVIWRAYLTNAHTSESHGFGNLDELFAYLRQQTCPGPKPKER
jgi:hypothetical protein